MNLQFMKRSHVQDVGSPINMGTAYGVPSGMFISSPHNLGKMVANPKSAL